MNFLWDEFLYKPLLNLLLFLDKNIPGHDFGIAIIVLTVLVRLVILPLGIKASRSQRKMKSITPELNKIKEQHKGDQQALAKAQMELYKQYGVNPLSSCLPILIQLPLIWALYMVLREGLGAINPNHIYPFLNISVAEKLNTTFLGIVDLAQPEKIFLPILAGITQYILSVMTTPFSKTGTLQEKMIARQTTILFPVVTIFIAMGLPAGLSLYWVATTLFSIGQQLWVNREKMTDVTIRIKKANGQEALVIGEKTEIELKDDNEKKSE